MNLFYLFLFISRDITLLRVVFVHNITTLVKCTLEIIYVQFYKRAYTTIMMVSENWIWMVINEVLWNIFTFSSVTSRYINLLRVIIVQKLTNCVKFTLALIYNQLSKTSYTQWMLVFESWIIMVINEVLWVLFNFSPVISG